MAVQSVTTGDYLQADDSFLDPTSAFTIAGWFKQGSSTPSGGTFRTFYNYGDDLGVDSYLYIGSDTDTNDLVIGTFDGVTYTQSAAFTPVSGTWYYVALVYDGANAVKFYVDGTLIDTLAITVSGFTFVEKKGIIGGSYMDFGFGYIGVWQAALSSGQQTTQKVSASPVTTALAFTRFSTTSDLTDITGNGHDWTSFASLSTIADPPDIPQGQVYQIAAEALESYDISLVNAVVPQIAVESLESYDASLVSAQVFQIAVEVLYSFNGDCHAQPPIPPIPPEHPPVGCVTTLPAGTTAGGSACVPNIPSQ